MLLRHIVHCGVGSNNAKFDWVLTHIKFIGLHIYVYKSVVEWINDSREIKSHFLKRKWRRKCNALDKTRAVYRIYM